MASGGLDVWMMAQWCIETRLTITNDEWVQPMFTAALQCVHQWEVAYFLQARQLLALETCHWFLERAGRIVLDSMWGVCTPPDSHLPSAGAPA